MQEILKPLDHFNRISFERMPGGNWPLVVSSYSGERTLGLPHDHDFFELAIVLSGTGTYCDANGQHHQLTPGKVFLLRPGTVHCYIAQRALTVVNVLWYPEEVALPLHDLVGSPGYHALFELEPQVRSRNGFEQTLELDAGQLEEVAMLLRHLQLELTARAPGARLAAYSLFGTLLVKLCRSYAGSEQKKVSGLLCLDRVLAYIHRNYAETIRCSQLARLAGMSEAGLYRHFMQTLGNPPARYILELRVQHAEELLRDSDATLSEVALRCGFSDGNHLGVVFRRMRGMTPRKFRMQARENKKCHKESDPAH